MFERISHDITLGRATYEFIQIFVNHPSHFFYGSDVIDFDIEPILPTLEMVVTDYLRIDSRPPHGKPLARHLIKPIRQRVIRMAKLYIAPSGDISDISDGIIIACWKYAQQLKTSKEIHTIHTHPHR